MWNLSTESDSQQYDKGTKKIMKVYKTT